MKTYCTNPNCSQPHNTFPDLDERSQLQTAQQKYCHTCGMPQILAGRYLPQDLLGKGGFGTAYLACDRYSAKLRQCVVKQFQPSEQFSERTLKIAEDLFAREAEVLETLGNQHPQIPELYAFFSLIVPDLEKEEEKEFFYIVQEFIDGETLEQEVLRRGKFSEEEVREVLETLLHILQFVHEHNSIHRDIKPSNIIRDREGKLYLLDFGAVKRVTTGEGTSSRSTGIYSVDFAPVEQIQGRKVYPSTDLYALAGTCIRLATGKPIQELHDSYNNRWIWRDYCEMSEQLAQILEKMLLPTPKQRFPSTQAVLNALQADSLCFQAGETSSIAISEKPAFSQPADWRLLLYPPSSQQLQDSDLSKDSQTDQSLLKNQTSSPEQGFPVEQATASKKGLPPVVYLMLIIILVSFAGNRLFTALNNSQQSPTISRKSESEGNPQTPSSETSPLSNRLSTGEKILIPSSLENYTFWEHKQKGTQAIAAGNYSQAVQHLEAALEEQRNSPETLIYLNNARIGEQDAFTIAVTVPIENDAVFFALEMLRGYAQAQQEINQAGGINGKPIKLMIADDDDDPKVAMEVAQALAAKEEILAVSGHWSSSTTLAVIPVYDENELVLVNPVSTSTKISGASEYVFRTIPSNFVVGATMANYALNYLNVEQVAIFYDSNSSYSLSLRQELKTSLSTRGGRVATEFDLSETGFLAKMRLQQAKDRNAEVIVLIPAPRTIDRALQVVNVNEGELPLIGDIGNLYGIKTLQVGGEDAVGMAFPIPWHVLKPGSPDFVQNSRQLWGGDVNWATVMTYDAMNAIAQALKQAPTREGIQDTLSRNDFSSPGVKETVKFLPSGDREGNLIMVEVQPANPSRSGTGYDFVPLNFN